MNSIDRIAMKGGNKPIQDTELYTTYHAEGFIPTEDCTFTTLKMGEEDLSTDVSGVTYYAGIFYGAPNNVGPGYYTDIKLATGSLVLALTLDSPDKY
jgi:hypothetical protein